MKKMAAVAMSGGVDSTVTALLLKQKGYRVFGISMRLFKSSGLHAGSCCSIEDIHTARRAACKLDIPHFTLDLTEPFDTAVIRDFVAEYSRGRTPNPCIVCNRIIKFDILLKKVRALGADFLATGHYIRKSRRNGRYLLSRARDRNKDQSYFLYDLGQTQLHHLLFPLGGRTKKEVREYAKEYDLPNADKPESQEICFVEDNDHASFLKRKANVPIGMGPVYDTTGNRIGSHRGFALYTVGQRKGLVLSVPGPKYVVKICPEDNRIIAGSREESSSRELTAEHLSWVAGPPPRNTKGLTARIRYRHEPSPVRIKQLSGDRLRAEFLKPQFAVTPGQAVVFYRGDLLLGGGTITAG